MHLSEQELTVVSICKKLHTLCEAQDKKDCVSIHMSTNKNVTSYSVLLILVLMLV